MEPWRNERPVKQLPRRYDLRRFLGAGNMAEVYLAWDKDTQQEVAVKFMTPDASDRGRPQRFSREGRIALSLTHQHVIRVYDFGDNDTTETRTVSGSKGSNHTSIPYIVMEHIKGKTLYDWIKPNNPCKIDDVLCIMEQLCAAVQYIHYKNLIHRDIKPANILFREPPQEGGQIEVVLSDFGLAVPDNVMLSRPKAGTPAYMAPEQRKGKPEKASDIYSLGLVLYQLCTGHLQHPWDTLDKPTLRNPALPVALDAVVLRALSSEPSQRFASATQFMQAIQDAVRETS